MPLPFDVNAFIEKHKSSLSVEELTGVQELSKGYMSNSDYQRKMNALKAEHAQKMADEDAYHQKLQAYEQEHIRLLELREQIERSYGSIDNFKPTADPNVSRNAQGDLVSTNLINELKQTISTLESKISSTQESLGQFAAGSLTLMHKLPKYVRDYESKYEKDFDGASFMQFAQENNIADPDQAYKLFVLKDEQDYLKKQHQKEIEEAKAQAVRDFASRHHIPEDRPQPRNNPLRMPVRPQQVQQLTQTTPTVVAAPAPAPAAASVASPSTNLQQATSGATDLAARMQANFLANKDK